MKRIVAYHLFLLACLIAGAALILKGLLPSWLEVVRIPIVCALVGCLGGITYCLRAVYLNACVRKQWDDSWWPWYYIRPVVSFISGGVSFIFLKAGLLVLDATQKEDATLLGFYALAFVAGFNVDKFMAKIEDIAHASWGIQKSRAAHPIRPEEEKD